MLQQIEQLKHGTTLIFPRTSQEAVLVNYKNKVQTLGDYINRTIITPNESPQNLKVQYNKQGEIINTEPIEKLNIFVEWLCVKVGETYKWEKLGESKATIDLSDYITSIPVTNSSGTIIKVNYEIPRDLYDNLMDGSNVTTD